MNTCFMLGDDLSHEALCLALAFSLHVLSLSGTAFSGTGAVI